MKKKGWSRKEIVSGRGGVRGGGCPPLDGAVAKSPTLRVPQKNLLRNCGIINYRTGFLVEISANGKGGRGHVQKD